MCLVIYMQLKSSLITAKNDKTFKFDYIKYKFENPMNLYKSILIELNWIERVDSKKGKCVVFRSG